MWLTENRELGMERQEVSGFSQHSLAIRESVPFQKVLGTPFRAVECPNPRVAWQEGSVEAAPTPPPVGPPGSGSFGGPGNPGGPRGAWRRGPGGRLPLAVRERSHGCRGRAAPPRPLRDDSPAAAPGFGPVPRSSHPARPLSQAGLSQQGAARRTVGVTAQPPGGGGAQNLASGWGVPSTQWGRGVSASLEWEVWCAPLEVCRPHLGRLR